MEARLHRLALGTVFLACALTANPVDAQIPGRFEAHSPNFIVFAQTAQMARAVSAAAEKQRSELAMHWLGQELPGWSMRCPIYVTDGPRLGAGGETRFTLLSGQVGNWSMHIQGTPERIIDSVLPHELTHTILATYFAPLNKHVPRWADEGACTTVEHASEKKKHNDHLVQYLRTGRGISFNRMFSLKDYPRDILPLYAQGHSVVQFLIDQSGPRQFVSFLEDGMRSEDWEGAVRRTYLYETLGNLKEQWNQWIADGRPQVVNYSPLLRRTELAQGRTSANPVAAPAPRASVALAGHTKSTSELANNSITKVGNDSWYRRQLLRGITESSQPASTNFPSAQSQQLETQPSIQIGDSENAIRVRAGEVPRHANGSIEAHSAAEVTGPVHSRRPPPTNRLPIETSQSSTSIGPAMVPLVGSGVMMGSPYAIWR